ncbi:MAG: hypothetical protein RJQ04_15270 [Longimicrobiales bacterium]
MNHRHARGTRLPILRAALLAAFLPAGLAVAPPPLAAQAPTPADTTALVEIVLHDGGVVRARILSRGDPLRLLLPSGDVLEVAAGRVREIRPLTTGRSVDGVYWPEDPNRTSLFLGPTARTLPQGRGYVGVYELFFPLAGVGVTDWLTLAGGAPILGELLDEGIFYLAPKLRIPGTGPHVDVAVGALSFFSSDDDFGVGYAVITAGSRDAAVTAGALLPWYDSELGDEPAFLLGAEARVSRSVKLMTENYVTSEAALLTFGPRFFGDRLSADVGVAVVVDDRGFDHVFPIINFLYRW